MEVISRNFDVRWEPLSPDHDSADTLTEQIMSMAFLRDDAEGEMPRRFYDLPDREDPDYDRAATKALLEATRVDETQLAERATGYYWGEPCLRPYAEAIRIQAEAAGDERLEQLARRFQR